jgi:cytochrome c2
MCRGTLLVAALVLLAGAAWAEDGAQLYEKKCKVCHSIGGVGGAKKDVGGPLDDVGSKRDEAWLRAYFADPKSKIEGAKMPKLKMTDAEWDAIVKYILSLKGAAE